MLSAPIRYSRATSTLGTCPSIDRTNYRQHIGKFNSKYNIAHPAAPVQSLAVLQVIKTSIQAIRPHQLGVTPLHQRRRGQVRTR
jgi:hypothetical protein